MDDVVSVVHEGVKVTLREDFSDYMPHLAVRVDAALRKARRNRMPLSDMVPRLVEEDPDSYVLPDGRHLTHEAVRQRVVRLFLLPVSADGRDYELRRRPRGRRAYEVGVVDPEAPVPRAAPKTWGEQFSMRSEPRPTAPVDLSRVEAMLVRPAVSGLPAYTAIQVLGQLQAELFELRKAVDDLRRLVAKEDVS